MRLCHGGHTGAANVRRLDDFRSQRREVRQGNQTIIQEPGRTIIRDGGRIWTPPRFPQEATVGAIIW